MIKNLVQTTLDTALADIHSHNQRKSGPDASQYIVYSKLGDADESFADDVPLVKNAGITVKYYYRADMINTSTGRQAVSDMEEAIEAAMIAAGFGLPFGPFDAGDVDDIEYFVTVFEFEYWRVV